MASQPETLVELLQWRAHANGSRLAYVFAEDGEKDDAPISYVELDARARMIAAGLDAMGARGERALLLYPPGLDFIAAFFGCLYAGVTAVPIYPPRLNRPMPRIQAIVRDAEAKYALTDTKILGSVEKRFEHEPLLKTLHWLNTTQLESGDAGSWQPEPVQPQQLAFLQYTSGSTSAPKGVMVSHANLIHNLEMIRRGFHLGDDERGVFWLPSYHDMGLIGGILEPIYVSAQSILLSPVAFLQRPYRWLEAITRFQATITGAPNFAFDLCVDKVSDEQLEHLDLSSLRLCFTGAEPVRPATMARFAGKFGPRGYRESSLYPCYGLAEATLLVSGGDGPGQVVRQAFDREALKQNRALLASDGAPAQEFIGCGRALPEEEITIVDPEHLTPCAEDAIGEIWVKGRHVAGGYWGRPEQSAAVFKARTAAGAGPYLRTGDLGFLHHGELFITGRLKDLIIIRGKNHYPQDIEATVAGAHQAIDKSAIVAFSYEMGGEERLAVVAEVTRKHRRPDMDVIAPILRRAVAEQHGLQASALLLVKPLSIPKTSSGKVRRRATRQAFLDGSLTLAGEWRADEPEPAPDLATQTARASEGPPVFDSGQLLDWLLASISARLNIPVERIDPNEPFSSYGIDSAQAVSMTGDLEDHLGRRLSPTLAWDYPSPRLLADYLSGPGDRSLVTNPLKVHPVNENRGGSIAVIGLALRFPGASTPGEFWKLLEHGIDAIQEVPPDRFDVDALYDKEPSPGKLNSRWGGFLKQVDRFAPLFFGISPREAIRMDPQQRLLMEVTWEALESAGIPAGQLAGSRAGVFVGISSYEYASGRFEDHSALDVYASTGNAHSIAANRLSYFLDLRGPSMAVDTACSSSLVATHMAVRSLRSGESELAIAAGVNLILTPEITISFSQGGIMAPDGRCKTFDARADGYVRGEGAGVILLKRLEDAERDGDTILAVIKGTAVNQDGRSNGLTAPNGPSQEAVIRSALADAGVRSSDISYVEAHGTGTPLGDPIEMHALRNVLGAGRKAGQPLFVGSVKTNIGHLEAAAGIAGLIKAVLAVQKGAIPPHLHFQDLNPYISLEHAPIRIPAALQPWPAGAGSRLAGVSSFGFGGTNAHLVLSAYPAPKRPDPGPRLNRPASLLALSARSPEALLELAQRYAGAGLAPLHDAAFTSQTGRTHFDFRLGVVASSLEEVIAGLNGYLEKPTPSPAGKPKVGFLFPGQGAEHPAMARGLYAADPTFRRILDDCAATADPHLDVPLLDLLLKGDDRIHETRYTQPALFSIEVALAAMWRAWGIEPDYLIGHSTGEWAAACVSEVFSLEDALPLVIRRGRLMQETGEGGMLTVVATEEEMLRLIEPYGDKVTVATVNGPEHLTLSGDMAALDRIAAELANLRKIHKFLNTDRGYHSPLMDPVLDEFRERVEAVAMKAPAIPIAANDSGDLRTAERPYNPSYWVRHIRSTVRFGAGLENLRARGVDVFLEIGPRTTLLGIARRAFRGTAGKRHLLPSLSDSGSDWPVTLKTLARLYELGFDIDWQAFNKGVTGKVVQLPTYPFQRERYWSDAGGPPAESAIARRPTAEVSLTRLPVAIPVFSARVADLTQAGLLELAAAAGREVFESGLASVREIRFPDRPAGIPSAEIQIALMDVNASQALFSMHIYEGEAWAPLAEGVLSSVVPEAQSESPPAISPESRIPAASPVVQEAPAPDIPAFLHAQIAGTLGLSPDELRRDQPLNLLGLDSLMAIEIRNAIEKSFHIEIPITDMLEGPTVDSLVRKVEKQLATTVTDRKIPTSGAAGDHPLTFNQQALWFLHELTGEDTSFNIAGAVRIEGQFQTEVLRQALQVVLVRHPALNMTFHVRDGEPVQRFNTPGRLPLVESDAGGWSAERLTTYLRREAWRKFNLETGPPFRVRVLRTGSKEEETHIVLFTIDHIVADFWSVSLIVKELLEAYQAAGRGTSAPKQTAALIHFGDAARWLNDQVSREAGDAHLLYWREQFSGGIPALDLPTDRPRPAMQSFDGETAYHRLPSELAMKLNAFARAQGTTLFNVLLAAFQLLLHRYSGQQRFVVGSVMAGREHPEFEDLVGYLINPVPLKAEFAGKRSFIELLKATRQTVLEAFAHQAYPPALLAEALDVERDRSRPPLFETMFIFQRAQVMRDAGLSAFAVGLPGTRVEVGGLKLEIHPIEGHPAQFDMTLMMAEAGDDLLASIQYNRALFDHETVGRMLRHFETLLDGITANPGGDLESFPLAPAAEFDQIEDWNRSTERDFPPEATVPGLISAQVENSPQKTAAIFNGESLSYADLDRAAARLATHLRSLGVGDNRLVGVHLSRTLELPVALLAIWKAGGAYVPLDPQFPKNRIDYMVEDAGLDLVLTDSEFHDRFPSPIRAVNVIEFLSRSGASEDQPSTSTYHPSPTDLAYVIYTSGSTGRPKGVRIPHSAVANFMLAMQERPGISANDVLLAVTTLSFDISILELFLPLAMGSTLVLADGPMTKDGAALAEALDREGITIMQATPSTWRLMLEAGWPGKADLKILCGGEALPTALATELLPRCAELWNMYGPTETTIWSTAMKVENTIGTIGIGTPIANTQVHILDKGLKAVPIGVFGELCIGGHGLAAGYLGRPGLTAEKFVEVGGSLVYRTGDIARRRADGSLEFAGRRDSQVKVRGFRIELGEIEAQMSRYPGVRQAVVNVQNPGTGEARLVGFLVLEKGSAHGFDENYRKGLRRHLQAHLPDYMVPAIFQSLDALPLTLNGKIDRKRLPEPDSARPALETVYLAPRNPVEQRLAELCAEVLGLDRVGVRDNFFDLGGTSLQATRLVFRVRDELGARVLLRRLFEEPTVEGLAAALEEARELAGRGYGLLERVPVEALLPEVRLDEAIRSNGQSWAPLDGGPQRVLLTGVTGYLGAFLLRELLDRTEAEVLCLVRATSQEHALKRIRENLEAYRLWKGAPASRIRPLPGDLERPLLGLKEDDFAALAGSLDMIYHNGALVNFVQPYEGHKPANVQGTHEIVRLASSDRLQPIHFVSSLSVFHTGDHQDDRAYAESEDLEETGVPLGGYAQSKWVGEKLLQLAVERGIPAAVYRPGVISGHSETGAWNHSDLIWGLARACFTLGKIPALAGRVDVVPVDYVSRAIVHLSLHQEPDGRVYHLGNPGTYPFENMVEVFQQLGLPVDATPFNDWREALYRHSLQGVPNEWNAFLPLIEEVEVEQIFMPRFDASNTLAGLEGSGITCPPVGPELLGHYLDFFNEEGFF